MSADEAAPTPEAIRAARERLGDAVWTTPVWHWRGPALRQRLRELRLARGWTLDELGRRANLGASTISRIETGKRTIGLDVLLPLAAALHRGGRRAAAACVR